MKKHSRVGIFMFSVLVVVALSMSLCRGENWPRLRGPNGRGISIAKNMPVKWGEEDYNWKIKLPGGGHGSPVVWGDKIFLTCADKDKLAGMLVAVRVSDGEILWNKKYELTEYRMNRDNSYAATTPAVDANGVYVLWPGSEKTVLEGLDHDGEKIWTREFDGVKCQHGAGGSPIVFEDIVVFTLEHEETSDPDAESQWIAVSRKTGGPRWKVPRQTGRKTSYSTPCVYSPPRGDAQLVFTSLAHGITGVDPGLGRVLWEAESAFIARVVSSPVVAGGLVIGTCGDAGMGKRLIAIRPGSGRAQAKEVYKIDDRSTPYVPTPLVVDGFLYTFHDQGQVSCLRSWTGELLWREKPAGRFYGSPVYADDKLYCITIDGNVVVIEAKPKYKLLAINPLGETSHATPAIAAGVMYLRTYSHLISIGEGTE